MLMMWFGFWLFNAIGGANTSWYAFPFFITFFVLVLVEIFVYAMIGAMIDHIFKEKS